MAARRTVTTMKLDIVRSLARAPSSLSLDTLSSFTHWWLEEFRQLLSNPTGRWLLGPQRKSIELEVVGDTVQLTLGDAERKWASFEMPVADYSRSNLEDFLRSNGVRRKDVDITVRLALDRFFCREMLVPKQALRSLDDIVRKDIERKTPFRLDEIFYRHLVRRSAQSGKLVVWQWIIKRRYVEEILARLQLGSGEVASVRAATTPDTKPAPMIGLLHGATQERSWYWTAVRALLVCAALLSLVALAGKLWQQQRALDDLDVQIAASRTKAQKVRTQIDELERKHAALARIRSEKAAPGLLEMWEQTTITLPSHSWLSELQLSRSGGERPEQQLNLSGYSDSAAGLVRIFDNSSLFEDATLTSPITVDPVETKERFGLRMKISDVSGKEAGTK